MGLVHTFALYICQIDIENNIGLPEKHFSLSSNLN